MPLNTYTELSRYVSIAKVDTKNKEQVGDKFWLRVRVGVKYSR